MQARQARRGLANAPSQRRRPGGRGRRGAELLDNNVTVVVEDERAVGIGARHPFGVDQVPELLAQRGARGVELRTGVTGHGRAAFAARAACLWRARVRGSRALAVDLGLGRRGAGPQRSAALRPRTHGRRQTSVRGLLKKKSRTFTPLLPIALAAKRVVPVDGYSVRPLGRAAFYRYSAL